MASFQQFQAKQKPEAEQLIERGQALYELRHYPEAEGLLRQAVARDPQNWSGHYHLGAALFSQAKKTPEKLREGLQQARQVISLRPELATGFFLLAWGQLLNRKWNEVLTAAHQGMRLDPQDAWGYSLVGQAYLAKSAWALSRQAADTGLKIDPEHTTLLNLRAQALIMLGEKEQARAAVALALRSDPSSSRAHANQGWLALYDNDPRAGLAHFREALRLDATSEAARAGLLQALHARNPLYRLLLRYHLWTSRLTNGEAWAFVVLLAGVNNAARALSRAFPPLWLLTLPYLACFQFFNFCTWVGDSFFNLLLDLSPTGRLVLSPDEHKSALGCGFTGLLFVINAVAFLAALFLAPNDFAQLWIFFLGAGLSLGMLIPVASVFKVDPQAHYRRAILITLAALLGFTAACAWSGSWLRTPWDLLPAGLFLLGTLVYPLLANLVITVNAEEGD